MPLTVSISQADLNLAYASGLAAVYADGGVLGVNPSAVGGTWAFCFVAPGGGRVLEASGVVAAEEVTPLGPEWVSNNFTEVLALLLAFEHLPFAWTGNVYSDSKNAISAHQRAAELDMPKPDYLPRPIWERMVAARERLGAMRFTLLGGHPTQAEVEAGQRKDGKPVSHHNVWCDKAATAAGKEYLRSIGKLPEKKPRGKRAAADLVSRADVLEGIRSVFDEFIAAGVKVEGLREFVIRRVEAAPRAKR